MAARERVRRFAADRVLPRFETLYRETIAAQRALPGSGHRRGDRA
jgi:hypothetical protein